MKTLYYLLTTAILLLSNKSYSLDYYTIADGNYTNTTTVWSLDGVTPCGCAPTCTLQTAGGDNLYINHNITLDCNIDVRQNSTITITAGASLIGTRNILIRNGSIYTEGIVDVSRLTVMAGTTFTAVNTSVSIRDLTTIAGTLNLDGAWFSVTVGNFTVESTGVVNMTNGTQIKTAGNWQNFGVANVCSTCCVESTGGNIFNGSSGNPIGTINGDGSLYASSGNLNNFSTVDMAINWCVNGSSTGMPMASNCTGAINICSASPLSSSSISMFLKKHSNSYVLISWSSFDDNARKFILQKSSNSVNWENLYQVVTFGNVTHQFIDESPFNGVNYYRVVQEDNAGNYLYSKTNTINISDKQVSVYPNPIHQGQHVNIDAHQRGEAKFMLYDISGKLLLSINQNLEKGLNSVNLIDNLQPAHYKLIVQLNEEVIYLPLVIIP